MNTRALKFNMDNFIVAASNMYALRAIRVADQSQNIIDGFILTAAASASMIYHLLEISKHGMSGVPKYTWYEQPTLWCDRIFAAIAVVRFLVVYKSRIDRGIIVLGIASIACLMVSECQHVFNIEKHIGRTSAKSVYMVTHCLWHIGAFHIAHLLLTK